MRGPLAALRAAEQGEHKKTRERLELMSAASFEGIFVHVDGVVIDANQRLAEMLRCSPDELLGAETMRRSFLRALQVAPTDYRRRFRTLATA